MKKRFLAMLLAAAMMVSLAGCGKKEEPAAPVMEPEPVEEPSPVTEILQSPKYMVMIGAVALALICLTIGLIIRHRRKAKDEDEDF